MNVDLVIEKDAERPCGSEDLAASPPAARAGGAPHSKIRLLILCFVVVLYLVLSFRLLRADVAGTGKLTFPLDDTYIHMAMAKNIVQHGVWGTSPFRFASAGSSPGFILLLVGAYRLTGPTDWWSLVFSLGFGLLALILAWRMLRDVGIVAQTVALTAIVVLTPLDVLGILGMEHSLHLALSLAFLTIAGRTLARREFPSAGLLLLAGAAVSVRLESLFMIAVACLLFLGQRQIRAAVSLGLAAATPLAIYAAFSVLQGGYWLPNSVALKGFPAHAVGWAPLKFVGYFVMNLETAPYLAMLLGVIVALLSIPAVLEDKRTRSVLDMVFGGALLHLAMAGVGWVYRYESYLIAMAIAAIAFAIPRVRISRDRWAVAVMVILGLWGIRMLAQRALEAEITIPDRDVAIYAQQIQMARFLGQFEDGAVVAANDIGAISYYTNVDCVDLVGLGDQDVFRMKRLGLYSAANLEHLASARKIAVAVVYDAWLWHTTAALDLNATQSPSLPKS